MRIAFYATVLLAISTTRGFADPPITAVALSGNGQQVVLGSQHGIEIRSWPEMEFVRKVATKLPHVHDLKFSPDGLLLLAAGGSPAESGRVEVWDWPSATRTHELETNSDLIYRVAWSPDGSQWVSCSGDGGCAVFATLTATRLAQYEGHSRAVLSVHYLDTESIISVSADQTVRLWNSSNGAHVRTLDNHVGAVNDVALPFIRAERQAEAKNTEEAKADKQQALDGKYPEFIATISEDRTLRLWQPKIGRLVRFVRLASVPRSLSWSADSSKIYVGCNDGMIRVVDVESMEVTREIVGLQGRIHELIPDPRNQRILVVGESGWNIIALDVR